MKKRVLICGGRDFRDYAYLEKVMNASLEFFDDDVIIIQGMAPGADRLAGEWADKHGFPNIGVKANWDYFGKAAGTVRNHWMKKYLAPDLVIAFPGGRGTAHMVSLDRQGGIDVYEVPAK
jgi:predicted Rossmann-fold nucleotide-binding protein